MEQSGIRILVVDDHPAFAEATGEFLARAGLEVCIARHARQALESAEAFRPQIVLCDLWLPDSTGLDLAKVFRENPYTKDVIFVLHTAFSDDDLRLFANEAGHEVDMFLSKPLTEEKLNNMIDRFKRGN